MALYRQLSFISVLLIATLWIVPVLGYSAPAGCSCCLKVTCCCGCAEDKDSLDAKDISKQKHCRCSLHEKSIDNGFLVMCPSKQHKDLFYLAVRPYAGNYSLQTQKGIPITKTKLPTQHSALYILTSSFLM